jgi:hypothetical protein
MNIDYATIFLANVGQMKKEGKLPTGLWEVKHGLVFIRFSDLCNILTESSTMTEIVRPATFRNALKALPGFLCFRHVKKIGRKSYRCLVFSYKTSPKLLKELVKP